MSALEAIRQKKLNREPLTAIEQVILDAWYNAPVKSEWTLIAEQAANKLAELETKIERLKFAGGLNRDSLDNALARIVDLETALKVTYAAMQKVRDEVPEQAYYAIITLVPEWVTAWDLVQQATEKAGTS